MVKRERSGGSSARHVKRYKRGALHKKRRLWSLKVPRAAATLIPTRMTVNLKQFAIDNWVCTGSTTNDYNSMHMGNGIAVRGIDPLDGWTADRLILSESFQNDNRDLFKNHNMIGYDEFKVLYKEVYISKSWIKVRVRPLLWDNKGDNTQQPYQFVVALVPHRAGNTVVWPDDQKQLWQFLSKPKDQDPEGRAVIKPIYKFGKFVHNGPLTNVKTLTAQAEQTSTLPLTGTVMNGPVVKIGSSVKLKTLFPPKEFEYKDFLLQSTAKPVAANTLVHWHMRIMVMTPLSTGHFELSDPAPTCTFEVQTKFGAKFHFSRPHVIATDLGASGT